MYRLLGGLRQYLRFPDVITDSVVFRLHNLFTTSILVGCSLIITASQYVGRPIECITDQDHKHVINTFCWITSTFTMPDAFKRQAGTEVAFPGVSNDFNDEGAKKYYTYYQWVCFVLFFQAMACYVPKVMWDMFEGGLMRTLSMGLKLGICEENEKTTKKELIIDYLLRYLKRHNWYALRYYGCECLCLLNVIVQLYLMNRFFDGEFLSYGWRVMTFSSQPQDDRVDPMVYVFPRVTKCLFYKYGPSGSIQKLDTLCVLPLNIVNEKTYVFIWFWFMFLATMLTILVIYRILIVALPKIRPKIFHANYKTLPIEVCRSLTRKIELGDWWVLMMLGKNMDPLIFRELVSELTKRIESDGNHHN